MRYARSLAPRLALALALLLGPLAGTGRADRPTSGDMSLLSGRTLGNGETVLAAGLGYPSFWAELMLAPSSTFNLGFRGSVAIASPVMGFGTGVGGSLSIPIRLHLLGAGTLDIAAFFEPMVFAGAGALAGQLEDSPFANNLGFGVGGTVGAVAGAQVADAVTLIFGLGGDVVLVLTEGTDAELVGTGLAFVGVEALMSRDTMLFVEARGGVGFKPELLFEGPEVVRISLGLAYLL
jgi:hypothetical protein